MDYRAVVATVEGGRFAKHRSDRLLSEEFDLATGRMLGQLSAGIQGGAFPSTPIGSPSR
jgi:hypothetical protein